MKTPNISNIDMGSWVKQIADERRWSYTDLAKAINCSRSSLYGIFNSRDISLHRLIKLSEVLNYDFLARLIKTEDSSQLPSISIPIKNGIFQIDDLPEYIISELRNRFMT